MKKYNIICGLLLGVSFIGLIIMLYGVSENNDNIVHLGLALVLIPSLFIKLIEPLEQLYEEKNDVVMDCFSIYNRNVFRIIYNGML